MLSGEKAIKNSHYHYFTTIPVLESLHRILTCIVVCTYTHIIVCTQRHTHIYFVCLSCSYHVCSPSGASAKLRSTSTHSSSICVFHVCITVLHILFFAWTSMSTTLSAHFLSGIILVSNTDIPASRGSSKQSLRM